MKFHTAPPKKFFSYATAGFLILSFVLLPISQTFDIKKVEAISVVEVGPSGVANFKTSIESTISAINDGMTAASIGSLQVKEFVLDTIAWQLINVVISEMIRSVTKWVNSGFKGSPAFVTDLRGFLEDIADKAAGNFIYGTPLGALCSPFSLDIKSALNIKYNATKGLVAQCRITNVFGNVDKFIDGDFFSGGWDNWYQVALIPQNNVYGALLESESGLYANIAGAQSAQIKLLDFGNGFLSVPDPSCQPEPGNVDGFDPGLCPVVTPGSVVQTQLNNALDLPNSRIAVADELNELIGALLSQLAKEALGGVGGLLGLTESSRGSGTYFNGSAIATPITYGTPTNTSIQSSIDTETKYLNFQRQIITLITDAGTYKDRVYGIDASCTDGALSTSLANQLTNAQLQAASSVTTIARLNVFLSDYNLLQSPTLSPSMRSTLLIKYSASTIPEASSNLMEQYVSYQVSGALSTVSETVRLELVTLPAVQTEISSFTSSIDSSCEDTGTRSSSSDG